MKLPTRTFDIPRNSSGEVIQIKIQEPGLRAENLSLATWGSSVILGSLLHKLNIDLNTLGPASADGIGSVLELGAGTGVVGLAAAAIWGTHVTLSDLAPIIPGLGANISLNTALLSVSGGSASCGTLDWADPSELALITEETPANNATRRKVTAQRNQAIIILAADTVYSEDHPALLSKAIMAWLKPGPDSRLIITYPVRTAYLDELRDLWTQLERIGLEAVEEGKEIGDESWDDELLYEWSIWGWRTCLNRTI